MHDFHPIAELTGFLALEAALKIRASRDPAVTCKGFTSLMRHALKVGWLSEERLPRRLEMARLRVQVRKLQDAMERLKTTGLDSVSVDEPTEEEVATEAREMKVIESICRAAVDLRNALAHGERILTPGSYRRLRTTADLINQLFAPSQHAVGP